MSAEHAVPRPASGLEIGAPRPGEATIVVSVPPSRHFEVSPQSAELLRLIDGARDLGAIAAALASRTGDAVSPEALRDVIERTLVPAGLASFGEAPAPVAGPQSMLWFRTPLLPGAWVARIAAALTPLFRRGPAIAAVAVTLAAHAWFYASHPQLQLENGLFHFDLWWPPTLVFIASNLVHELGHSAALMSFGQAPGTIGMGLYLVFPILFSDVSRAWRLPRLQRAVVDMGGIHLQMLFSVLVIAWYLATQSGVAARAVALIDLSLLANLNPFLRMDGYWLVADLSNTRELRKRSLGLALGTLRRRTSGTGASDGDSSSPFLVAYTWLSLAYFVAFAVWLAAFGAPRLLAEMRTIGAQWSGTGGARLQTLGLLVVLIVALGVVAATLWVGARTAADALRAKPERDA